MRLLRQFEGAKVLAGGQSLIPLMKLRIASLEHIVDISDLTELSYIKQENGTIRIGALVRSAEVEHSTTADRGLRTMHIFYTLINRVSIHDGRMKF